MIRKLSGLAHLDFGSPRFAVRCWRGPRRRSHRPLSVPCSSFAWAGIFFAASERQSPRPKRRPSGQALKLQTPRFQDGAPGQHGGENLPHGAKAQISVASLTRPSKGRSSTMGLGRRGFGRRSRGSRRGHDAAEIWRFDLECRARSFFGGSKVNVPTPSVPLKTGSKTAKHRNSRMGHPTVRHGAESFPQELKPKSTFVSLTRPSKGRSSPMGLCSVVEIAT